MALVVHPLAHLRTLRRTCTLAAADIRRPRGGAAATAVDWVEETSVFFRDDTRPIMLFDGVCNLCNGGVRFVRDNDRQRKIRFEALQSESGKKLLQRSGRSPDDISSVVLVEEDSFVRDFAYDNVANNRYAIFGRAESCEI
ncbi:DCC family protein [Acorus calamus]|uniref:DCC family protein n=1 Tax=Acorus calamus TaxID=4465 RepID=A0AAV9BYT9_ACOCL|nr:DCC family protein [Acorus calamus]